MRPAPGKPAHLASKPRSGAAVIDLQKILREYMRSVNDSDCVVASIDYLERQTHLAGRLDEVSMAYLRALYREIDAE